MGSDKIHVQMFGDFSLSYNGEKIVLERNSGTKAAQLLQYLIYHGSQGASRERLVEILYADDNIVDPLNNLKVNIFRLRKLLEAAPLPPCEYITYQNGKYVWKSDVEVEIDARIFASAAQLATDFRKTPAQRRELLLRAASLYTGDFLPMLSAEPWVAMEAAHYRKLFIAVAEEANSALVADRLFEESLALSSRAASLAPYEEKLHLMRISALLDLRRYPEAFAAYDEAASLFMENLGVSPSKEMQEIYHRITGTVRNATALVEEIRDNLHSSDVNRGAYYCNYPGFIDSYLFTSRLAERCGKSVFLMLSTITNSHGVPLELGEKLSISADCLQEAIRGALRGSDLFTRYSPCQFLMLLVGITREDCNLVAGRLSDGFRDLLAQKGVRGVRAHHTFTTGLVLDMPERDIRFSKNAWNV